MGQSKRIDIMSSFHGGPRIRANTSPFTTLVLYCWLTIACTLLVSPPSFVTGIAVEDWVFSPLFAIGQFNFFENGKYYPLKEALDLCMQTLSPESVLMKRRPGNTREALVERIMSDFLQNQGQTLSAVMESKNNTFNTDIAWAEEQYELSLHMNRCALPGTLDAITTHLRQTARNREAMEGASTKEIESHEVSEWLNHLALLLYPKNYAAAKNLAFVYECSGYYRSSRSLYADCYQVSGDAGCQIHAIQSSPILPYSEIFTESVYIDILRSGFHLLLQKYQNTLVLPSVTSASGALMPEDDDYDVAINILREVAINTHYLGFSPGRIFELISRSTLAFFPDLSLSHITTHLTGGARARMDIVDWTYIGIVSEHFGNSSPGNCMIEIFQEIAKRRDKNGIAFVFFDRLQPGQTIPRQLKDGEKSESGVIQGLGLNTVFGDVMREISIKTVYLNEENVSKARKQIAAENLDALLYLALPTGKFTYFLSLARLAPIQIQLGVGHPLSSASPNMDYSVVSTWMYLDIHEEENSIVKSERESVVFASQRCAMEAYLCEDQIITSFTEYLEKLEDSHLQQEEEMKVLINNNTTREKKLLQSLSPLNYDSTRSILRDCEMSLECYSRDNTITPLYYSEQVVLFDSIAHFNGPLDGIYQHSPEALAVVERSRYHSLFLAALNTLSRHEEAIGRERRVKHMGWCDVINAADSLTVSSSSSSSSSSVPSLSTILPSNYASTGFSCEELDAMFREMKIYSQLSSADLPGCPGESDNYSVSSSSTKGPRKAHIYHCLQYMKKMHPIMDEIFLRIIYLDPTAKFLVAENFQVLFRRMSRRSAELAQQYGWRWHSSGLSRISIEELSARFIRVPRITHLSYLVLLSLSSVFLNALPYGSGMTSSEALYLGLPVIMLPKETSVLHFAQGQLRALGDDIAKLLIASSREQYAQLAVDVAYGRPLKMSASVAGTEGEIEINGFELRKLIVSRLDRLFGQQSLRAAAQEWEEFLGRASNI